MGLRTLLGLKKPKISRQLANHYAEAVSFEIDGRPQTRADATWYRGPHCNFYPDAEALSQRGALSRHVAAGWLPARPFITRSDPITTFGSCFAEHITKYLSAAGYDVADKDRDRSSYVIRCGEGMVNTAAIAQQFQWAYGETEFNEPLWYDKKGNEADYEESVRQNTRSVFDRSTVFIITLGLSEVWYNQKTGEVFWRAIPKSRFDPEEHGFKVLSVEENRENLETIYRIIRQNRPNSAMIFTLSPVPLVATFRPVSCITANSVSKASLRVAVDELMRAHKDDEHLFYFPSYEIVKDVVESPYQSDMKHVRPEVVSTIMELFHENYLVG